VETSARDARVARQDARKNLETLENQIATGIRELRSAFEHLDGLPALLQKTLEQGLGGILKGMDSLRREHEQLAEKPRRRLEGMHRLVVMLLVLSCLSAGTSVVCLILLLVR